MAAQRVDLTVEQGATFRLTLSLTNPDNSATDLTGASVRMQLKPNYGDAAALLEVNTSTLGGIAIGSPATAGTLTITLTAAQTQAILIPVSSAMPPSVTLHYDVLCTFPSGDKRRLLFGFVNVLAALTV